MKLSLLIEVDNATDSDIRMLTAGVDHLTGNTQASRVLMRKGKVHLSVAGEPEKMNGKGFKNVRTVTLKATKAVK